MCGIAGVWSFDCTNFQKIESNASKILESISHRGPDGKGNLSLQEHGLVFNFCRLSFQDLTSLGNQPMVGRNWVIVFNGEIYNFKELKQKCVKEGWNFKSNSDSEVILSCFEYWGVEALSLFDGMFAIAAYNLEKQNLYLIRDPSGEKPLYWFKSEKENIYFSSELKGIENSYELSHEIDLSSVASFFLLQYIPAPRTIYKNVFKLKPGTYIEINKERKVTEFKYVEDFKPILSNSYNDIGINENLMHVKNILLNNLQRRIISDVPIGAFLSSGIDSSLVVALTKLELGINLSTFSIGFKDSQESEHFISKEIAKQIGTDHHEIILEPNDFTFLDEIGKILDEPLADSSCFPVFKLSKYASGFVKGVLTGDGGDELFAGYPRYGALMQEVLKRTHADPFETYLPLISISKMAFIKDLFGTLPIEMIDHLDNIKKEFNDLVLSNGVLSAMRFLDHAEYLPGAVLAKVDRMSMFNALETRTPFLETNLKNFSEQLPNKYLWNEKESKVLLRKLLGQYLPEKIVNLPKKGFGFPLTEEWTQQIYRRVKMISDSESGISIALGINFSKRLVLLIESNKYKAPYLSWAAIVLNEWLNARKDSFSNNKNAYQFCKYPINFQKQIDNIELSIYIENPILQSEIDDIILRFIVYVKHKTRNFPFLNNLMNNKVIKIGVSDNLNNTKFKSENYDYVLIYDKFDNNKEKVVNNSKNSSVTTYINKIYKKVLSFKRNTSRDISFGSIANITKDSTDVPVFYENKIYVLCNRDFSELIFKLNNKKFTFTQTDLTDLLIKQNVLLNLDFDPHNLAILNENLSRQSVIESVEYLQKKGADTLVFSKLLSLNKYNFSFIYNLNNYTCDELFVICKLLKLGLVQNEN